MSDINPTQPPVEAQPPVAPPPAPPTGPSAPDLSAEVERLRNEVALRDRQLESVRGNFRTEQERANSLAAQLDQHTRTYEAERATLTSQAQAAEAARKEREAELARERERAALLEKRASVSEVAFDAKTYPAIAAQPAVVRKAILNEALGLEGDALATYLKGANDELAQTATESRRTFRAGSTPPAPSGSSAPADGVQSFADVTREMNAALRDKGPRSTEYQELRTLRDEMIKQGLHKK